MKFPKDELQYRISLEITDAFTPMANSVSERDTKLHERMSFLELQVDNLLRQLEGLEGRLKK